MEIKLRRGRGVSGVCARFMSPLGLYPQITLGTIDSAFLYDSEASITLVRFSALPEIEHYYSEVEWAHPEEICLLASIALSKQDGECAIIPYPLRESYLVDLPPSVPLNDIDLLQSVKMQMMQAMRAELQTRPPEHPHLSPVLPPFLSNVAYENCGRSFTIERYETLIAGMKPEDYLLVRGLSTWLRSAMLSRHYQFFEEAITALFISLEASFRLILRQLKINGNLDPSAKDAAAFLGSVFNETPLERYFSEYYDKRVMSFHPESRFGVFPHAPVMVDDYYHLHGSLRALYAYLIGEYVELWS